MAMFYIKLISLSDFPLEERPISPAGQFKQSLESFYVTDSPLMAMFHIKLTSLSDFPKRKGQLVQLVSLNKVFRVSMLQIVL